MENQQAWIVIVGQVFCKASGDAFYSGHACVSWRDAAPAVVGTAGSVRTECCSLEPQPQG